MIKNLDPQQFACFSKRCCDGPVVAAGNNGTGRMVVGQHNGNGSGEYGSLEDFSWSNRGRVGRTYRHDRVGGNLILSIKIKSDEVLSAIVGQDGSNEVRHIGGSADLEHHVFAVEIIHSGFANERILNHGFWGCGMFVVAFGFAGVLGCLLFMVLMGLLRLIQKWAATLDDRPADRNYSSSEAR